jgi:hypothetical protein
MMQEKTREFLAQLRANPKKFRDHVGRSVKLPTLYRITIKRPGSIQGKLIMSLTYGYDLKDDDKILEAPTGAADMPSPKLLPGGALVNHLPFCTIQNFYLSHNSGVSQLCFSAAHSFMGPIPQLRTIRADS